jgi:hypothetical protein
MLDLARAEQAALGSAAFLTARQRVHAISGMFTFKIERKLLHTRE